MNRSEFIKNSALALAGVALLPLLPEVKVVSKIEYVGMSGVLIDTVVDLLKDTKNNVFFTKSALRIKHINDSNLIYDFEHKFNDDQHREDFLCSLWDHMAAKSPNGGRTHWDTRWIQGTSLNLLFIVNTKFRTTPTLNGMYVNNKEWFLMYKS